MSKHGKSLMSLVFSVVMVLSSGALAWGQRFNTVPEGTVIPLRMDTLLTSRSSKVGDRFSATVFRSSSVPGRFFAPDGTRVEGHVTAINPGGRGRGPGAIAVAFDKVVFPTGNSIPIDATLTTLSEEGRRKIEQDDRYQDAGRARRAVVFFGAGRGANVTIGIAGSGTETTTVGDILGTVLGSGEPVEVPTGTEFGLMVERSFRVDIPSDVAGRPSQSDFGSPDSIRFAQITLRDRGFYTGPIDGVMSRETRNAIREFQRDRSFPLTGDLDVRTARELGVASDTGVESAAIEVVNPRAERVGGGSIRISGDVQTPGGGWQFFVNRFVSNNALHVYIRGVPPRYPSGSGTDHHPLAETYNDLQNVARVIFHGPQRDFTVDLQRSGGGPVGSGIGNPRQISFLANRLLQDFQRDLNIRRDRGQVVFDTRRNFRPNEVELLSQMASLQASAELYNQLTASITDPDAVKGAASGLMKQARLLERIVRRDQQVVLSSIVRSDLEQLQAEIARINLSDINVDNDIIR